MTEQERAELAAELELHGYLVNIHDGFLWIEGEHPADVASWVIEEDKDAWWVYEFTGVEYHSVDAFNNIGAALECAKGL